MKHHTQYEYGKQTQEFLDILFGRCTRGFVEVRAFHEDRTHQRFFRVPSEIVRAGKFATSLHHEVFFGVGVRSQRRGVTESVMALPALWLDADDNAEPWTNFPLTPLAVVDSGHSSGTHFHAYYAVQTPYELSTQAHRTRAVAFLKALCVAFKGDPNARDLARVLRVPGTINARGGRFCTLVEVNLDACYSLEEIRQAITLSLVSKHWQEGHRHELALSLSGYLATRRVSEDEARNLLGGLLELVGDNERKDRLKALQDTYERLGSGSKIKGYHGLAEYLSQEDLAALDGLWGQSPEEPGRSLSLDGRVYREKEGRIVVIYGRGEARVEKTLTSFTIQPNLRIKADGQAELLRATLRTGRREYPDSLFKRDSWNSKQKFLGALPAVDLQFFGSDLDAQAILALITDEDLPVRNGTSVLGRNGDLWVLPDGVLSKDGWVQNPKIMYTPLSEPDFDRRIQYPVVDDEARFVSQVVPLLLLLNQPKAIYPVLGWFFAAPFAPEIRRLLHHFPILVIWGTQGGGKSTLLRTLWECFGVKSELYSSTETPFTFLRLFSGTGSIPVLIDEFKPFNMKEDEGRLLIRYLKRLYDGEMEHRGRPDLSLVAYNLQAPVAIAGEVSPCSLETAMVERVVQVNLSPDTLRDGSPYVEPLSKLGQFDLRALAPIFVRWSLGVNIVDLVSEASGFLPKLRSVPSRVRDNLLVMVTGLIALRRFALTYGIDLMDERFKEGIEESITSMVADLLPRGPFQEIALTAFLETLATMAATGRIRRGIHYGTEDDTRLFIHLEDCLPEFRKFVRETNARIEILDKNAYQKQIREIRDRGGYITNSSTTHWFKADPIKGALREKFDGVSK